ncbi:MAG: hypothetical protein FWG15_02950 [Propionibacteriaceae bacterium]|nr:hypothetical protein [Propionibacteriaceae bacterium]
MKKTSNILFLCSALMAVSAIILALGAHEWLTATSIGTAVFVGIGAWVVARRG